MAAVDPPTADEALDDEALDDEALDEGLGVAVHPVTS